MTSPMLIVFLLITISFPSGEEALAAAPAGCAGRSAVVPHNRSRVWRCPEGNQLKPFDDNPSSRTRFRFRSVRRLAVQGAGAAMAAQASGLFIQVAATWPLRGSCRRGFRTCHDGDDVQLAGVELRVERIYRGGAAARSRRSHARQQPFLDMCGNGRLLTCGFAACGHANRTLLRRAGRGPDSGRPSRSRSSSQAHMFCM